MKVFFDSSVLIAASVEDHVDHERALPLLQSVHQRKWDGFVSGHALLEFFAVLTRLPVSPRILPLQAEALLEENVTRHFKVEVLTGREYLELVRRMANEGIAGGQVYDALHVECARKCGAERIFTFNSRHFQRFASRLTGQIVTP